MALTTLIQSLTLLLLVTTARFFCRVFCAGSTHLLVGRPSCRYHLVESCAYRLSRSVSVSLNTLTFNGLPIIIVFNFQEKNKAPCYSGPLTGGENRMSKTGNKCLLFKLGLKAWILLQIQELCKFGTCALFGVMNFALCPVVINFVLQKIDKIQINQSYLMQKAYPV